MSTGKKVFVVWKDFTGMGRAWAHGPIAKLDEVKELARQHLEAYCKDRDELGDRIEMCDPEYYTEHVTVLPASSEVK